jgi:hypothetical protein
MKIFKFLLAVATVSVLPFAFLVISFDIAKSWLEKQAEEVILEKDEKNLEEKS